MKTPYLDEMIEDLRNHIEHVESVSYSGIPETRKQLKELETIKSKLKNNGDLGDVMWRFSGIRVRDGLTVYGEYPFTYVEGMECYNISAFWQHVQSGYIDPNSVEFNAT